MKRYILLLLLLVSLAVSLPGCGAKYVPAEDGEEKEEIEISEPTLPEEPEEDADPIQKLPEQPPQQEEEEEKTEEPPAQPEPPETEPPTSTPPKTTTDGTKGMVALTFDDGPHAEYTDQILDILEENGAVATFFEVGRNLYNDPRRCAPGRSPGL